MIAYLSCLSLSSPRNNYNNTHELRRRMRCVPCVRRKLSPAQLCTSTPLSSFYSFSSGFSFLSCPLHYNTSPTRNTKKKREEQGDSPSTSSMSYLILVLPLYSTDGPRQALKLNCKDVSQHLTLSNLPHLPSITFDS